MSADNDANEWEGKVEWEDLGKFDLTRYGINLR